MTGGLNTNVGVWKGGRDNTLVTTDALNVFQSSIPIDLVEERWALRTTSLEG